ncbi:hypothetical protein DFJ73DRAFT_762366 [Zopfochytrium polystomum]|nr:hypothetical protein DFJ73DRAFT_762366 [Zopfochytrium polystomum]
MPRAHVLLQLADHEEVEAVAYDLRHLFPALELLVLDKRGLIPCARKFAGETESQVLTTSARRSMGSRRAWKNPTALGNVGSKAAILQFFAKFPGFRRVNSQSNSGVLVEFDDAEVASQALARPTSAAQSYLSPPTIPTVALSVRLRRPVVGIDELQGLPRRGRIGQRDNTVSRGSFSLTRNAP